MRLVMFGPAGRERPGVVLADGILPLDEHLRARGIWTGDSAGMLKALPVVAEICAIVGAGGPLVPAHSVRLGPPVLRPGKIIEIGFNTWSLLAASGTHKFREPAMYAKGPNAVNGPYDDVVRPDLTTKLDYEVELAVVVGRRCRDVPRDEAEQFIAGYTVANDLTARDVQLGEGEDGRYHRQNYRSKSFDTFCPLGPHLVTRDEVPDPGRRRIRAHVNGELRQDGSTADLVHGVPELLETVSRAMTLEVGDIILTGSPAGAGYLMNPPVFLEPGDVVTGEIEGLGEIRSTVT